MKITTGMKPNVTKTDRIKIEMDELELGDNIDFEESYAQKLARERLEVAMVKDIISASDRLAKTLEDNPLMAEQDTSAGPVSADFRKGK